jgi:hypothetical protein
LPKNVRFIRAGRRPSLLIMTCIMLRLSSDNKPCL